MAGLTLGITWSKTPDIVFTVDNVEIARIKFVISEKGKGKCINIEAKPYIKISRELNENHKSNSSTMS